MREFLILIISLGAGLATYWVANIIKRGSVMASAMVTLAAGMLLPHFFPSTGNLLSSAAATASYAGMISMENALNVFEMATISLMTGILFIAADTAYVGIGGKLGTIAAISCFAWLGIKKIFIGMVE